MSERLSAPERRERAILESPPPRTGAAPGVDPLSALPQQRSLAEHVFERLSAAIDAGHLPAGERLVEAQLATRLGVSRAPVREALRMLEADGLVETTKGRGTFVIQPSTDEVEQMVMARAVLEGLAARLVATGATQRNLIELRHIHSDMEAAAVAGNHAKWRDLDWTFHETLCALSGNHFVLEAWRAMRNVMRVYLRRSSPVGAEPRELMRRHEAFMGALEAGDPEQAERVFRSVLLASGYRAIKREIPAAIAGYVTETI